MAHGTPASLEDMPQYLTLVRGGRPPSDELIHEMRENYAAIGGRSPMTDELVIFTAHSLPARTIAAGDRYADEVAKTARGVADRVGLKKYERAYQSAGRTPEPWIGPSLQQMLDDKSATTRKFLAVPI